MTVHNNQEQLILWKEPKLYSGSRYKVDQGYWQDYDDWLDDNDTGTKLTLDIYRQTITEPMKLTQSLPNMDGYTYGKLSNAGKWYYIFIDRVTTDQYGTSTIEYSIDWWATEWTNINCTKAHLIRKPTKPQYMEQPFTPLNVTGTKAQYISGYCIMATYIPSTEHGTSYISTIILPGNEEMTRMVEQGYWYKYLNLPGADIKDCFIVPVFTYSDFDSSITLFIGDGEVDMSRTIDGLTQSIWNRYPGYTPYIINNIIFNEYDNKYYLIEPPDSGSFRTFKFTELTYDPTLNIDIIEYIGGTVYENGVIKAIYKYKQTNLTTIFMNRTKTLSGTFTSNEISKQGIMDWNGNIIWECPYNIEITSFKVTLIRGISHTMLEFDPIFNSQYSDVDLLTGKGFCYDCRHPGLFVDSYQDYVLKNRDYDIAMRQIQSDKQLWSSVSSMFENIGFGFAFGDSATAHKGNSKGRLPYGAIASGVGSLIETIGTFVINSNFDPQIQKQYDSKYRRMTDQISLVGDSITKVYLESSLSKYTLTMDSATQNRMNDDITTNGYYCDEITTNLSNLFHRGNILQADNITVEGAVQLDCRYQVVNRLMNGVEFI